MPPAPVLVPADSAARDPSPESFRQNAWVGFAAAAFLILLLAVGAILALRSALARNQTAFLQTRDVIEFSRFQSDVDRKVTALRNYLVLGDEIALVDLTVARSDLTAAISKLEARSPLDERRLLRGIREAESEHEAAAEAAIVARRHEGRLEPVQPLIRASVEPRRVALERAMSAYVAAKEAKVTAAERTTREENRREFAFLFVITAAALATIFAFSLGVTRRLTALFAAESSARLRAEEGEEERARLLARERLARNESEAAERRSAFLARASQALSSSLQSEAALGAVALLVVPEICDWCFVDLVDGESVRRVAVTHGSPEDDALAVRFEREHLLDRDASVGPFRVLRTGVPELVADVSDEFLDAIAASPEAYELLRKMGVRSVLSVPIRDSESIVGILTFLTTSSRRRLGPEDLRLAEDLAIRAGIALQNVGLFELVQRERAAAEWHERRSSFLARASEILASSLDYRVTLSGVGRLAVPEIADWCLIDMVEGNGELRTLFVHHSDADRTATARTIGRLFPWDPEQPYGPPHVVRTRQPELATDVPDRMVRAIARGEEHLRLLQSLEIRSYMCVPVEVRGEVLGTITFLASQSQRRYEPNDLALAEALSYRASLAIDNSRLYGEAQEAIRARDEFLSIASHELKTPITTLQIQIQGLLRRVRSVGVEAAAEGLVGRMAASERQVERLTHLIDDLLDISRITAGRLEFRIEPVDLASVVREVAARMDESLARAGCTLAIHASEPQVGQWDRLRLDQVVTNLLSNAMKYGGGKPIEVRLSGDPGRVRLDVEDQGIGIDPENQSRIFERFERAVSGHHYGGLGLGLWIARQIVDGLRGRISVQSVRGKGSVFSVDLPRARPADSDARSTAVAGADGNESEDRIPA